jgi:hypothetical protein
MKRDEAEVDAGGAAPVDGVLELELEHLLFGCQ